MLQFPPSQGGIVWVSLKIMKKKDYIKPQIEVVEMQVSQVLTASANDIPVGGDGQGGGDALSNDRRGSWGNLWSDDKK